MRNKFWKKAVIAVVSAVAAMSIGAAAMAADYREDASYPVPAHVVELVGTGVDAKTEIQAALDQAEFDAPDEYLKVVLKGDFKIRNYIAVHSNTIIDATEATITSTHINGGAYMLRNDENDQIGKYDLTKNVWVVGGTWSGGNLSDVTKTSDTFSFGHIENLNIIGATVMNNFGAHLIEFTGVKDVLVQDCKFFGFKPGGKYNAAGDHSIGIQLEVAYPSKDHAAGGFLSDKTVCQDVRFLHNEFNVGATEYKTYDNCIGSNGNHIDEKLYHKNIKVQGNTMNTPGNTGAGVYVQGWEDFHVDGNTIKSAKNRGIYVIFSRTTGEATINDNIITNCKSNGIVLDEKSTVTSINGNTITGCKENGIKVTNPGSKATNVNNNTVKNCGIYAIQAASGGVIVNAKGNIMSGNKKGTVGGDIKNTDDKGSKEKPADETVTRLTVNVKKAVVGVGEKLQLKATVTPSSAAVSYKSNKAAVAAVDKNGKVTAKKTGKATITVTAGKKTAKVVVTVKNAPASVSIQNGKKVVKTLNLKVNQSAALKAKLQKAGAASYKLTWKSSAKGVVAVDAKGKITAKKAGTANITVTTYNGKKATVKVTVK